MKLFFSTHMYTHTYTHESARTHASTRTLSRCLKHIYERRNAECVNHWMSL